MPARGTATFTAKSCSSKLAPVKLVPTKTRPRPVAVGPFVATTSTSIAATCSTACPFKGAGCYVETGFTKFPATRRDVAAKGHTAEEVIAEEARLIDSSFGGGQVPQDGKHGGRDLRLHVAGDVGSAVGACVLGGAAIRWRERGGGSVWTFTHRWHEIDRAAWGPAIAVLASVESPQDIEDAREAGYAAAIVVAKFPSTKAFTLPGSSARIIPCPAEVTKRTTCVECRLCLDRDLLAMNAAIAFEAHGPGKKKVEQALVQVRRSKVEDLSKAQIKRVVRPGTGGKKIGNEGAEKNRGGTEKTKQNGIDEARSSEWDQLAARARRAQRGQS